MYKYPKMREDELRNLVDVYLVMARESIECAITECITVIGEPFDSTRKQLIGLRQELDLTRKRIGQL